MAKQVITNGEQGVDIRNALNSMFTEIYDIVENYLPGATGVNITNIQPLAASGQINSATPIVTGTTIGQRKVDVFVDNVFNVSTTSDLLGNWAVATTALPDGAKSIKATSLPVSDGYAVNIHVPVAFAYQAETTALTGAFTTAPTKRRKDTIDWFFRTMKIQSPTLLAKIKALYVAGADTQSSYLNWVAPTGAFNLTAAPGGVPPSFLAHINLGSGTSTKYFRTGILLSTLDPTDCYLGCMQLSSNTPSPALGALDATGAGLTVLPRQTASQTTWGAAGGPYVEIENTVGSNNGGQWAGVSRLPTDVANIHAYRTSSHMKTTANAAVAAMGAVEITLCSVNNNGVFIGGNSYHSVVIAKGLTEDEQTTLSCLMKALQYDFQFGELNSYEPGTTPTAVNADVIVYGGTSGGAICAYECMRQGLSVAVVGGFRDHRGNFGGMTAGGLGAIDWQASRTLIKGLPGWLMNRITGSLGLVPELFRYTLTGMFDPRIAGGLDIPVYWSEGVVSVTSVPTADGKKITSFTTGDGRTFTANVGYVDASYESDLTRVSGVPLTYGREAATGFGAEARNGWAGLTSDTTSQYRINFGAIVNVDPNIVPGDRTSGYIAYVAGDIANVATPVGAADGLTQAYNFRIAASSDVAFYKLFNTIPVPPGYTPAKYEGLSRWLAAVPGTDITSLFNIVSVAAGGGQYDWNNHSGFSTDMPGSGTAYQQAATYAGRKAVWKDVENYLRGLLYHVARSTDPRVTASAVYAQMQVWGFHTLNFLHPHPDDKFNWMPQLYVRSMYRMLGDYIHTADDCSMADGTVPRSIKTITTGAYFMDTHAQNQYADYSTGIARIWKEGDVGIAYGANVDKIVPFPMEVFFPPRASMQNLLSIWAISSTQSAMSVYRMEFSFMMGAQSAGCMMAEYKLMGAGTAIQDLSYALVRARILASPTLAGEVSQNLPQVN